MIGCDRVRFTASAFYEYERPSRCGLRVRLRAVGEQEAPPGPFQDVLRRLGERHERQHLAGLGESHSRSSLDPTPPPSAMTFRSVLAIRASPSRASRPISSIRLRSRHHMAPLSQPSGNPPRSPVVGTLAR